MFGNRWKSEGAKFGDYGGGSNNSYLKSLNLPKHFCEQLHYLDEK